MSGIPIISAAAPVAAGYDAWICDIWGVIHNGVAAFRPAVDACRRFRAKGGTVLFLTNAPRPAAAIAVQLDKLNVARDAFDAILTSGDLTAELIARHRDQPVLHLGPERDRGLFEGPLLQPHGAGRGIRLVDADTADVVICSGLYDDERETPEHYREQLVALARRNVPMVCANPDLTVARGDRVIPCAGAIAQLYEAVGGHVVYAGKPHLPVYERAFEMIAAVRGEPVARSSILAIGDGLRTDMLGASNAGLAALFVASPVHFEGALTPAALAHAFAGADRLPIAATSALAW